ncbi:MAG: ABC transporter ATP-binding protein [Polyangiaceae bacterium]
MENALESVTVRRVVKRFGSTVALRGVDAEFQAGRVNLIVGENGSGKSTLLGIIGTMMRPTSGSVAYRLAGGQELDDVQVRSNLGWVSHEALAYPDLSGRANIALAAELHGVPVEAVWSDLVRQFDLGAFVERPLRTNSRGQRQRVALAKALLHEPSVVLLDEPTTGLDASGVERLLDVIRACVSRRAIVIVVAHDPDTFARFEPVRVRLARGRVEPV